MAPVLEIWSSNPSIAPKMSAGTGQVAHACNHSTWEVGQEDHEFKVTLKYRGRPCLRKTRKTQHG
jgi:hypothetical protein